MKARFFYKPLALLLAAVPMGAQAFAPFTIKDIQITGLRNAEAGSLFSYIAPRVGTSFNQALAADTVRRLFATGLFNDVQVDVRKNVVHITVDERPTIASVLFDGLSAFNDKEIIASLARLGFGEGRPYDPALQKRVINELRQQYILKGNYGVDITTTLTPLPNHRVGVSFQVNEGKRARITDIQFTGNQHISNGQLRREIDLTTPGIMTWYTGTDKFSRERLESDLNKIRQLYFSHGFLDARVDTPQVSINPELERIQIAFTIHEGAPYVLRKVRFFGNLLGMQEELQRLVNNQEGKRLNMRQAQESAQAIKTRLGELGYAFAEVTPIPQPEAGTDQADLTFAVNPGKRIYVRQINIGGNVRTRDAVIRREMRQEEAAWYDAKRLSTSEVRIQRLGYFDRVSIQQQTVPGTDDQVDILVDVKEKPTGLINFGVGFGSSEGLSFQGGLSQENIFGSGTNLSLDFNTSKTNRNLNLRHVDPYWTESGISRTTRAYFRLDRPLSSTLTSSQKDDTHQTRVMGLGLDVGVPISERDRIFFGATLEQNRLRLAKDRYPVAYQQFVREYGEKTNALILTAGWSKDTRNDPIAPSKGFLTSISGTLSLGHLKYSILSAQQQLYLPLGKDFTLAFNLAADWGRTYGTPNAFPVIKNLMGGGIGSVRGYEASSLGPRDSGTGDFLGGSTRYIANVQLFLPFPGTQNDRSLRWFVFGDAGKIGVTGSTVCTNGTGNNTVQDPCGWRYSTGVGLSWQSPLGPLQISYAIPIRPKQGDAQQRFQFHIGTSF